jgi:hypothetical protein
VRQKCGHRFADMRFSPTDVLRGLSSFEEYPRSADYSCNPSPGFCGNGLSQAKELQYGPCPLGTTLTEKTRNALSGGRSPAGVSDPCIMATTLMWNSADSLRLPPARPHNSSEPTTFAHRRTQQLIRRHLPQAVFPCLPMKSPNHAILRAYNTLEPPSLMIKP